MDDAAARDFVFSIIRRQAWMMACLTAVRALELTDAWIGAGFVRRAVWDALLKAPAPSPLDDVDVLYFDAGDLTREAEARHEARLRHAMADVPWSVRNQARMHLRNGDAAYRDCEDAIGHWLETPTAVAVRLDAVGDLALLAPFGLEDLLALRIRPTPAGKRRKADYLARIETKNWRRTYPCAVIER